MAEFKGNRTVGSATLGERFARLRQEEGYSLKQIEEKLGIQAKYIVALEDGQYNLLPGEIYIKSFLKKYAEFLKVNPDMVLSLYDRESKIVNQLKKQVSSNKEVRAIITPKTIRYAIIIIIVIAILIYLAFQIKMIFVPPKLTLDFPPENYITDQSTITFSGSTEPEAQMEINGQEVMVDPDGNYSQQVDLQEGVNSIRISVSKERSQPTVLARQILYKKDGNNN